MVWTREDPGAGEPGGIRAQARLRTDAAQQLRATTLPGLNQALTAAGSPDWQSKAATAVAAVADTIVPEVTALITAFDNDAAALTAYASEVEQIKDAAMALRIQEARTLETAGMWERKIDAVRSAPRDGPLNEDVPASLEINRLETSAATTDASLKAVQAQWDDLEQRRRTADSTCVTALTGAGSRGNLAGLTGKTLSGLSASQLLDRMTGMTAAEVTVLFTQHPELGKVLATAADPTAVAAWWASIAGTPVDAGKDGVADPSAAQAALIGMIPAVIGNLGGIAYTHRDQANRAVHKAELANLQQIEKEGAELLDMQDIYGYEKLLADSGYDAGTFGTALGTSMAIKNTLDSSRGIDYQLVQYQPGSPPLAAISVGNMDTASQVTTNVPGMGSSVSGSVEEWTGAARNLHAAQSALNGDYGTETGLAVVAWLGYDAPPLAQDGHLDVFYSDRAETGGADLSRFLEGVTASRGWQPGENLSLVGHSYGTTTAGFAAAQTPVDNLTLLASAGLDDSIASASELKVPVGHVWASEANADAIADIGRGPITVAHTENPYGVGSEPRHYASTLGSEHRVNPVDPQFGASVFTSEAGTFGSDVLLATTGHGAHPQMNAYLDGTSTSEQGYLDRNSTSLHNTAGTSLGIGRDVLLLDR